MAKLNFKKCRARNFRSISNSGLEINFDQHKTTAIASTENGSGKSTMCIFSIYYALFGKSYTKGSKVGGLVNTRSNKDCIVELEFETKGSDWLVKRGQKPSIFEIYQDGIRKDNEASIKDPQALLESIIGFNEQAFHSTIALGVNRFVPFVEFSAAERRTFVENMLDLTIISDMASNTKERIKGIKKQSDQAFYEGGTLESKLTARKRTLQILEEKKRLRLAESGDEMSVFVKEETDITKMLEMTKKKLDILNESIVVGAETKQSDIKTMLDKFKFKAEQLKTNSDNVIHLNDCPTCKQGVTEEHKTSIKETATAAIDALVAPMEKLTKDLNENLLIVNENNKVKLAIGDIRVMQAKLESRLTSAQNSIKALNAKTVDTNEDALIDIEQKEINLLSIQVTEKEAELNAHKLNEVKHNQFLKMLGDDGVKASIVQQYLPFLVSDINKTLDKMNLYLNIDLDSEFNISMKSPTRKNQTIENLSSGQACRVNLATLLAWRNVSKKKASVDVNILILDEILESLSANGVREFMEYWIEAEPNTNLFVVTQRNDEFEPLFDNNIIYSLKDDMTVIV